MGRGFYADNGRRGIGRTAAGEIVFRDEAYVTERKKL